MQHANPKENSGLGSILYVKRCKVLEIEIVIEIEIETGRDTEREM